jgi:hypothetical protein
MFYERKTNKPWKLKWDELVKLYNESDKKKVRNNKNSIILLKT